MTVDTHQWAIEKWRSEIARHDQAISEHQRDRDIAITMLEKELGKPVPPEFLNTQSGNPVIGQMPCGCPLRFPISHRPGCSEYQPPEVDPKVMEAVNAAVQGLTQKADEPVPEAAGKRTFLVALASGGTTEDPVVQYVEPEIIETTAPDDAVKIYNAKHNCSFYYGRCLGEIIRGEVRIPVKLLIHSTLSKEV